MKGDVRSTGESWTLGRRPALDGLRALAVVAVMLRHSTMWIWMPKHLGVNVLGGYLGVTIFFVVSGFLITSLLVEEWDRRGDIDLKAFWIRRGLRLMPPLAIFLVVLTAYAAAARHDVGLATPIVLVTVAYISNIATAAGWLSNGSLQVGGAVWSLAIEEQFYLLWPTLLRRALRGRTLRWALAMVAVGFVTRIALGFAGQFGWAYYLLFSRLDELGAGAALAIAIHRGWVPSVRWRSAIGPLLVAVGAVMLIGDDRGWVMLAFSVPVVTLLSCGLVLGAVQDPGFGQRTLSSRGFVLVGRWSYSIYLFHQLVLTVLIQLLPHQYPPLQFALGFGLSCAIAAAMRTFVELPVQRLKQRFDRVTETRAPALAGV